MTTTLSTPTDALKAIDPFDLDDLATELKGVSSTVFIMSELVEPKRMQDIDTMSDNTMHEAFFSIIRNIERIMESVLAFEDKLLQAQKETATPTDESKDCR